MTDRTYLKIAITVIGLGMLHIAVILLLTFTNVWPAAHAWLNS